MVPEKPFQWAPLSPSADTGRSCLHNWQVNLPPQVSLISCQLTSMYLRKLINSYKGSDVMIGISVTPVSKWTFSSISVNKRNTGQLVPDPIFLPLIQSYLLGFLTGLYPITRIFWLRPQECLKMPRCVKSLYLPQPSLNAASGVRIPLPRNLTNCKLWIKSVLGFFLFIWLKFKYISIYYCPFRLQVFHTY